MTSFFIFQSYLVRISLMTASPICTYVYKYLLLLLHLGILLFVASVSFSEWKYQWVLGENLKCFLTQKEDQLPLHMMGGFTSHPSLLLPLCDSLAQILHVILNVIYRWEGVDKLVRLDMNMSTPMLDRYMSVNNKRETDLSTRSESTEEKRAGIYENT